MTVQTTTLRADYTGNGTTTAFTVPFYFLDNTHVIIYRTQISTGVISTLALTTDYTLSGAGVGTGGTATMVVAPTTDQRISILRNVPQTQLTHYVPNDPFPAASHENALDQLTMLVQQLQEAINRAVKSDVSGQVTPDALLASINASVASALASATAASGSASSASTSATNASNSANNASTSATNAATSATNAANAVTNAIGVTVQGYDSATAKTNVTQTFTKAQRGTVSALTDGATITPDFAAANNFSVTLGGNRTLANPTNLTAGQSGVITITQDGTGSRTLAFGSYWKFASGVAPTLTTAASAVDDLAYYVESSTRIVAKLVGAVA